MYRNGNATSNTLIPPTPRGSITPVTMAKAFHPIEKMLPVSPGAQSTQVLHTQALNLLQDSQVAEESTVRKPMLVKMVEQPMDQSDSSTAQTQIHWLVLCPLHRLGWTWWSLQLLVR